MSYQPIPNPLPVSGTVTTTPSGTQTVSGTVTANAGSGTFAVSGPLTDAQLRATAVPVSLTSTTITGTVTTSVTGSVAVTGTFWQATQPVSIAATVNVADAGGSLTVDAPVTTPVFVRLSDGAAAISTLPVSGPLTDTQLRASAVPVSLASTTVTGTVAVTQSGAWTVQPGNTANTTPWLTRLSDGTNNVAVKAASVAAAATDPALVVAISPNNTVAATQSGTWNIGTVTTLPALVAGSAIIGKVGIDQTTVGTTNAVSIAQLGANAVLTGVGAAGTGSLRVTLSSDAVSAAAALADALANPTLGQQAVLNSVFNGSTWDRQRGMGFNTTTGDTGAKTATGNGATIANVGNKGVAIVINLGAVTGTTPTCVFKVQGSADGGTTWYDIPGATTASLTATGVFGITIYPGIAVTAGTTTTGSTATANMPIPRTWRMVWTIGGTTPSFTITNIQYNYLPN